MLYSASGRVTVVGTGTDETDACTVLLEGEHQKEASGKGYATMTKQQRKRKFERKERGEKRWGQRKRIALIIDIEEERQRKKDS